MKWIIILLMAFFYTACGDNDEEQVQDPGETNEENPEENEDEDPEEPPTIAQSAINPNVLICAKEDKTLTFELKQYEAGSTECDLENSKCKTACGCELTLTEEETSEVILCSNSIASNHCSQGFEQVKQGLNITGNTSSKFRDSFGEMDCQPGTMDEEEPTEEDPEGSAPVTD